jgi:serine/threonine protein kinase
MFRHFINEVHYLTKLQHPYIVKVIETAKNKPLPIKSNHSGSENPYNICSYIAMEFAERGNLFDYVCFKALSENATCFYFRQLLSVIQFMHRFNNVCHRDLKPENLLLTDSYDLRVADFGFAGSKKGTRGDYLHFSCKGTLGYMAPEILNIHVCETRGYNSEQTDMFALGVILFSMVMGRPPFWKADPM